MNKYPLHAHAASLAKAINRPGDEWVIERIEEAMRDVVSEVAEIVETDCCDCEPKIGHYNYPYAKIRAHFELKEEER